MILLDDKCSTALLVRAHQISEVGELDVQVLNITQMDTGSFVDLCSPKFDRLSIFLSLIILVSVAYKVLETHI